MQLPPPDSTSPDSTSPAITAHNLTLTGTEGAVFGPVDFEVPATGLCIITGQGGSGRIALALTLAGRMRASAGDLTVLGETTPAKIRPKVAVAGVEQIDFLDRDVTVAALLTEQRNWARAWWKPHKRADEVFYEQVCGAVFGTRPLPPLSVYVSQLAAVDRILLRIAFALAPARSQPVEMLVLADLEQVQEAEDRRFLLGRLDQIAQYMPVVVDAVNPPPAWAEPPAERAPYHLISLDTPAKEQQ